MRAKASPCEVTLYAKRTMRRPPFVPMAKVPTHTSPLMCPLRSTGRGRRESTNSRGENVAPLNSIGCGLSRPSLRRLRSSSTKPGSRAMKKSACRSPLSPRCSAMSCDSSWSTFHTRRRPADGKVELERARQGLVPHQAPVGEALRRQQALLDHRVGREAAGHVVALDGAVVAVEHRQRLDGVELVVEVAGEDVARPGVDAEEHQRRQPLVAEACVEGELLVDVRRADDVARSAGRHVEVVGACLEARLHDREVEARDQRVDDQVDVGQSARQRVAVVRVEDQRRGLGADEPAHLGATRLVEVGQHDCVDRRLGGDDPGRHLPHRTDSKLQDSHAPTTLPHSSLKARGLVVWARAPSAAAALRRVVLLAPRRVARPQPQPTPWLARARRGRGPVAPSQTLCGIGFFGLLPARATRARGCRGRPCRRTT